METVGKVVIAIVIAVIIRRGWKVLNWVWLKPKKLEKWLRDEGYKGNSYKLLMGDMIELGKMMNLAKKDPIPITHDILPHILPFDHKIISTYGISFFYLFPHYNILIIHIYQSNHKKLKQLIIRFFNLEHDVTHDIVIFVTISYKLIANFTKLIVNDFIGEKSFLWLGPNPRVYIRDPELIKEILLRPNEFQKPHPEPFRDSIIGGLLITEGHKWSKHRKIINPAFNLQNLKVGICFFLDHFDVQNLNRWID